MHLTSSTRAFAACVLAATLMSLSASAQIFGGGQRRPAPTVLHVGVIHPVDAEPIRDGVLIFEGAVIQSMGKQGEIDIPKGAKVLDFKAAHAYPGLVDAHSGSYASTAALRSTGGDAATDIADALDFADALSRDLARAGVTTSYVSSRAQSRWRGLGAYVRSTARGGGRPVRSAPDAAVHMTLTGNNNEHPTQRAVGLRNLGKAFDSLKAYTKAQKKFDKALGEYEDEYEEYIEHFEKLNPPEEEAEVEEKGEKKTDAKEGGTPKKGEASKKGEKPGAGPEKETPKKDAPKKDAPAGGKPKGEKKKPSSRKKAGAGKKGGKPSDKDGKSKKGEGEEKAPEKPKYPKPPRFDAAKETLIELRDGKRSLRVEARRAGEIRAALALKDERAIDSMILEGADAAATLADDIAKAGIPVVITRVDPVENSPYGDDDVIATQLKTLREAGVQVAIGSSNPYRARNLPLIAARAAALGLGVDQAVRAITIDAANILGLGDRVGSIAPGKIADVLITSGPLLSSQSRILQVFVGGRTVLRDE